MSEEKMSLMEFDGYVTQLASGSEVATIGIKIKTPKGGLIEVINITLQFSALIAAKKGTIFLKNSNAAVMNLQQSSLNDSYVMAAPFNIENTSLTSNSNLAGFKFPLLVPSESYIECNCAETIQFAERITVRCLYKSRNGAMAEISAIGAGITLTTTTNKQV